MEEALLTNYENSTAFRSPVVLSKNRKYSLGRGLQNDHVFEDISISRIHCTIEESGRQWFIIDKSSNGTFVNGTVLGKLKARVLQDCDVVTMGETIKFQFIKNTQKIKEILNAKMTEMEILNFADEVLAGADNYQFSRSLEREFDSPMGLENTVGENVSHYHPNYSNVTVANVNGVNTPMNTTIHLMATYPNNIATYPQQPNSLSLANLPFIPTTYSYLQNLPQASNSSIQYIPPSSNFSTPYCTNQENMLPTINNDFYQSSSSSYTPNLNANVRRYSSYLSQPITNDSVPSGIAETSSVSPTTLPVPPNAFSRKIKHKAQTKEPSTTNVESVQRSPNPKNGEVMKTPIRAAKKMKIDDCQPSCSKTLDGENKGAEDVNKQVETESKPSCSKTSSKMNAAEDELQCSICTEMFVKAVTLNCSHTFCRYCIDQWRKKNKICPICRTSIKSIFPTLVIDNFIEKILEDADEELKSHRSKIIADRESNAAKEAEKGKKKKGPQRAATSARTDPAPLVREQMPSDPIVLSSESEIDSDDIFYEDDEDYGHQLIMRMQHLRNNFLDRVKEHLERSLYTQIQLISMLHHDEA